MKKLRKEYNKSIKRVVMTLLLLVSMFNIVKSQNFPKLKLQVPVTYNTKLEKGEDEKGAVIDELNAKIIQKLPNGGYIVAYNISGMIINESSEKYKALKKLRLIELDLTSSTDEKKYDKLVTIVPVRGPFFRKSSQKIPFNLTNELFVDYDSINPIKKILFTSENKEFLLELP